MEDIIRIENLNFRYSSLNEEENPLVLKDLNINIKKGEFLAILGHNGSGKSTLARLINGLYNPSSGKILVKGMDTQNKEDVWKIRETAGMVFQNPDNQIVATIVEEDVAFGPENLGVEPSEIKKRVDNALKTVDMEDYRDRSPHLLSGGQKQRIAIAGILAMEPECIIFDEPTAMLDPTGRKEVINTINKLIKQGTTIVLITHYMEEVINADRVIVLEKGEIALEGKPREVFSKVDEMKRLGLDIPQMTELSYLLKEAGVKINKDILSIEELLEVLE